MAKRGSILLAELVAILLVVEYTISNLKNRFKCLKILSDSQTAVGILTLNWKSTNYLDVIRDIKENVADLQRSGIETVVSWTPGHANIAGNELADSLAKEAAKEATSLNEQYNVVTRMDINQAAKQSTLVKWQNRGNLSPSGRHLYELQPILPRKYNLDTPNHHNW